MAPTPSTPATGRSRRPCDGLTRAGRAAADLPENNRSTIVSVPLSDTAPAELIAALHQRGVVCSVRDGNLRLAVHFYNHEDDIEQVAAALAELAPRRRR